MHLKGKMPFKMHKIIFFQKKKFKTKYVCLPYLNFLDPLPETNLFLFDLRAIPEKNTWGGGETANDIFFYGWLVRKDFKLCGSLVSDQIKLHGWLVFRCVEREERILSARKREKFYQI